MKREAYLVSDQTHRRDERREGRAERQTVRQASLAPKDVGLQDLTPFLSQIEEYNGQQFKLELSRTPTVWVNIVNSQCDEKACHEDVVEGIGPSQFLKHNDSLQCLDD